MTSASELFHIRRHRLGRNALDLGFDSSSASDLHHHRLHVLDAGDSLRRYYHLRRLRHPVWVLDATLGKVRAGGHGEDHQSELISFLSTQQKEDAQSAINDMTGKWLGNRQIRCNWATKGAADSSNEEKNNDNQNAVVLTNGSSGIMFF